jgi:hypothetical protein
LVVHVSGAVEQEALFEYISENEERKVSSVSGVTELGVDGPVKDDVTYIPLDRIGTLKGGVYTPSVEKAADFLGFNEKSTEILLVPAKTRSGEYYALSIRDPHGGEAVFLLRKDGSRLAVVSGDGEIRAFLKELYTGQGQQR